MRFDKNKFALIISAIWAILALLFSESAYEELYLEGAFTKVFCYLVALVPIGFVYGWRWVSNAPYYPRALTALYFILTSAGMWFAIQSNDSVTIVGLILGCVFFVILQSLFYDCEEYKKFSVLLWRGIIRNKRKALGCIVAMVLVTISIVSYQEYKEDQLHKRIAEDLRQISAARAQVKLEKKTGRTYSQNERKSALSFTEIQDGFLPDQTSAQQDLYLSELKGRIFEDKAVVSEVRAALGNAYLESKFYSVTLRPAVNTNDPGFIRGNNTINFTLGRNAALSLSKGDVVAVLGTISSVSHDYIRSVSLVDAQILEGE